MPYAEGTCEQCGEHLDMLPIANPQPQPDGRTKWDVIGEYACNCGCGVRSFYEFPRLEWTMPRLVRERVEIAELRKAQEESGRP